MHILLKYNLLIIIILIFKISYSQIATVNSKDGYTNLRKKPNRDSEIINIIKNGDFFFWGEDDYDPDIGTPEWIWVTFPKNKYSFGNKLDKNIVGYIHKSQILPLDSIDSYNNSSVNF